MAPKSTRFDVLIIGGGPAGISASFWCHHLGMTSLLIEGKTELGGQLLWIHNPIKNYLGVDAANGREFRDRMLESDADIPSRCIFGTPVVNVDLDRKTIDLTDGSQYSAKAIVIATGVSRRKLGICGEESFAGKGVLDSGARWKNEVFGKIVTIVGGGDAAFENALILREFAGRVYLVHRRSTFNARREFVEKVQSDERITVFQNQKLSRIEGGRRVENVEVVDTISGVSRILPTDFVLARIGVEPCVKLFENRIELDKRGYIITGRNLDTNVEMVYAIGDVANPSAPTIAGANGDGSTVAKVIGQAIDHSTL